ncbi:MAG: TerD family protein [Jatrophihabitantaceae bacterium]
MSDKPNVPVVLAKGANIGLRELDAELGSVTVILETCTAGERPVDADVSVLLLSQDGRVRSNDDMIFYNQPVALAGAIHLRDKIRSEPDDHDTIMSTDVLTLELDDVPEDVHRIIVAASLDSALDVSFGDAQFVQLRLQRTSDAHELLMYRIEDAKSEKALLFGELYRRAGEWRIRAIGQGYSDGLAALATEFGIDIDSPSEEATSEPPASPETSEAEQELAPARPDQVSEAVDSAAGADVVPDPAGEPGAPARRLSVRRSVRAPKLPADWDRTIPAEGEMDWQQARLFPVAGIGVGEEQERRATSSLLAVMSLVRDFGRALTAPYGAPAGLIETFIEVPFGHDDKAFRPDGVIRVTRGQRTWTALVEVKTSSNELQQQQIDTYVDIARAKEFDAVLTISNQVTGAVDEHPVSIERRKLRKLALRHLSWDEIRTQAILTARHHGIADPGQRYVLMEFIRYMQHSRSGLHGFANMGPQWVKVREDVKARTLRSSDRHAAEVAVLFDQLIRFTGLHLTGLLGVVVQPVAPRNSGDTASRCQQLADSGLLFGTLRVPGAAGLIVITADLRAERVSCSITVDAPREGRPTTRVNWLLRQLSEARDATRVEAILAGSAGRSTAQLLGNGKASRSLDGLIPKDGRDIRAFRVSLDLPMGGKRATGQGSLIGSVLDVVTCFYAEVVQNLSPWASRPPRMPVETDTSGVSPA